MTRFRFLTALLAVLLTAAGPPSRAGEPVGITDFDGNRVMLDRYVGQGKWVVLMLWASDCHICEAEAPVLNAFHERHRDSDAIMLGVSLDGVAGKADARAFLDRHSVSFVSLLAEFGYGTRLYSKLTGRRWIGTPTFMIFEPEGRLVAQQIGAVEPAVIERFMASYGGKPGN